MARQGKGKKPERPTDLTPHRKAIEAIMGDRCAGLEWADVSPNPYSSDDADTIEIFRDARGQEYWVRSSDARLVQVGPHPDIHANRLQDPCVETRKEIAELRAIANAIAAKAHQKWEEEKAALHPLEDNRRGRVYFFRHDDFRSPCDERQMPPFLQVALYADGDLAAFTDTLL